MVYLEMIGDRTRASLKIKILSRKSLAFETYTVKISTDFMVK